MSIIQRIFIIIESLVVKNNYNQWKLPKMSYKILTF